MAEAGWRPTVDNYLGRVTKARILEAVREAKGDAAAQLIDHCRAHLAHYKCPTTVDFVDELPRLPTGKLLKRELRARYAGSHPDPPNGRTSPEPGF